MKQRAAPWRGATSYILFLALIPLLPPGGLSHTQNNRATVVYPELILPSDTFFQPSASFLPNKLVFAHYMLCCGAFDWDSTFPTLADAAIQDIQMAQAMGIDGFALNLGAYDSGYQTRAAAMFQGALQLNTGFRLFFSADMCCSLTAANIVSMMSTYGNHSNYFKVNGRQVLSTFSGGLHANVSMWRDGVLAPLNNSGINVYFVPYFFPDPIVDPPTTSAIQSHVTFWASQVRAGGHQPLIDGLFNFATAELPYGSVPNLIQNTQDYGSALTSAGKLFMAALGNYYWGSVQTNAGRRSYNYRGGEGTDAFWQAILASNASWVEIITWNDWAESYTMPIDDFTKYWTSGYCMKNIHGACIPAGWYQDHRGMAELNRYYIQWFKTGVQPTITKDSIFYSYILQTSTATATNDSFGAVTSFGDSVNNLYVTVAMTAAGVLECTSGPSYLNHSVPAGMTFVTVPAHPGTQNFSLSRNGKPINSLQGPNILTSLPLYDYWPATGYVETTSTQPSSSTSSSPSSSSAPISSFALYVLSLGRVVLF